MPHQSNYKIRLNVWVNWELCIATIAFTRFNMWAPKPFTKVYIDKIRALRSQVELCKCNCGYIELSVHPYIQMDFIIHCFTNLIFYGNHDFSMIISIIFFFIAKYFNFCIYVIRILCFVIHTFCAQRRFHETVHRNSISVIFTAHEFLWTCALRCSMQGEIHTLLAR